MLGQTAAISAYSYMYGSLHVDMRVTVPTVRYTIHRSRAPMSHSESKTEYVTQKSPRNLNLPQNRYLAARGYIVYSCIEIREGVQRISNRI